MPEFSRAPAMGLWSLWTPAVEVAFHAAFFLSLNVFMNYLSKFYLAHRGDSTVFGPALGYEFPIVDSLVDCAVGMILCLIIMLVNPALRQVSLSQLIEYKLIICSVVIFHLMSIVLNNLSLVRTAHTMRQESTLETQPPSSSACRCHWDCQSTR